VNVIIMSTSFLLLCGIGGSVVAVTKEQILMMIVRFVIVMIG